MIIKVRLKSLLALLLLAMSWQSATAQEWVWAPNFPVGAKVAAIEAADQNGTVRTLSELNGEKGVLLMFSRSFDW